MGFSTALEDVASHYLSVLVIGFYILGSLQEGRELVILVNQILYMELLIPMHIALINSLNGLEDGILWIISTLLHLNQKYDLFLWRAVWQKQLWVLFCCIQQAYAALVIFYQVCNTILDKIASQPFVILLLDYMDQFWILFYQWTQAIVTFSIIKHVKIWLRVYPMDHELYTPIFPEHLQLCDHMLLTETIAYCKEPPPSFHLLQIPDSDHEVNSENQELEGVP